MTQCTFIDACRAAGVRHVVKLSGRLAPCALDGRDAVAVFRGPDDARPSYFIVLTVAAGEVSAIRDCRYAPYIAAGYP